MIQEKLLLIEHSVMPGAEAAFYYHKQLMYLFTKGVLRRSQVSGKTDMAFHPHGNFFRSLKTIISENAVAKVENSVFMFGDNFGLSLCSVFIQAYVDETFSENDDVYNFIIENGKGGNIRFYKYPATSVHGLTLLSLQVLPLPVITSLLSPELLHSFPQLALIILISLPLSHIQPILN